MKNSSSEYLKIFSALLICFYGLSGDTDPIGQNSTDKVVLHSLEESSYLPTFRNCKLGDGTAVTQIRKFRSLTAREQYENFALVVDDDSLETSVVNAQSLSFCREAVAPKSIDAAKPKMSDYMNALASVSIENINALQNAGATHEINDNKSMYLTVDLCPSHKPLDIELFKKIQGGKKPVPVVISISGSWLKAHLNDLNSLMKMEANGEIKITWANHSFTHPYDPKLPNNHNFVLENDVNFASEVFENEILLLKHGIVPSVFFRFPGLVSDQEDVELLRQWGLIPLGANAWLALGEVPKIGSFILVHGNGNEPRGLQLLYEDMAKNPNMKSEFSDIHEAFDQ